MSYNESDGLPIENAAAMGITAALAPTALMTPVFGASKGVRINRGLLNQMSVINALTTYSYRI